MNNVSMIGENQQLVTDEPVEFEKILVEVQDCIQLLISVDEFCIYPHLNQKFRRMSTCNRLDLQALGTQTVMPKNSTRWLHCINFLES